MKRRRFLVGVGSASAVGLAGCLGTVGMDEHRASPAGVDPQVRQDTGYEQTNVEEMAINEEINVGGYTEEVTAVNYLTEHKKTVDLGPLGSQEAGMFMVLTTPQVSIAGQEFNPVAEMSAGQLVDLVTENYGEVGGVSHDEDGTVEILGTETTRSRFEARTQVAGQPIDIYLHVSESVRTASDHLVTVGAYPKQLDAAGEGENMVALMEGVVETVDESASDGGDTDGGSNDGNTNDSGGNPIEDLENATLEETNLTDGNLTDGNLTDGNLSSGDLPEGNLSAEDIPDDVDLDNETLSDFTG